VSAQGPQSMPRARSRLWLRELSTASVDGSLTPLLRHLARTDLLILDDWGLERVKDAHAQLLLEIVEDSQESGSVLITGQLPLAPGTS
jgi:DNA replication protein DnaC